MTIHRPGPLDVPVVVEVPSAVWTWRRRRLIDAGFANLLAEELASGTIDLHELLALVDRGCPPQLAARILAPLRTKRGLP